MMHKVLMTDQGTLIILDEPIYIKTRSYKYHNALIMKNGHKWIDRIKIVCTSNSVVVSYYNDHQYELMKTEQLLMIEG